MILGRRPRRQLRPLFYGQNGRVGERAGMSLDPAAISGCRRAGRVRPRGTRATPSCCRRAATSKTIRSRSAASSATMLDRANSFENRVRLFRLLMPSRSTTSPKSASTSLMSSFSPCQDGAVTPTSVGMRTGPAAVTSEDARAGGEEHARGGQRLDEDRLHLLTCELGGGRGGRGHEVS